MALRPEGFERQVDVLEVIFQAKLKGTIIQAIVAAVDYPNDIPTWILSFPQFDESIKGLVPITETGLDSYLLNRFVGQPVNVKVVWLDRENGLVLCSRKAAVEEARGQIDFSEGDVIQCTVRAVVPGRFLDNNLSNADAPKTNSKPSLLVDVGGGVLVNIPYNRAAIRFTQGLNRQFSIGQNINAKVLKVGFGDEIDLSVRAARPDPWEKADYKRGQTISGTVYHINDQMVYVEPDLTPGLLGLAPYPTIGSIRPGQRTSWVVNSFSHEDRKLRLRFRGNIQRRI